MNVNVSIHLSVKYILFLNSIIIKNKRFEKKNNIQCIIWYETTITNYSTIIKVIYTSITLKIKAAISKKRYIYVWQITIFSIVSRY